MHGSIRKWGRQIVINLVPKLCLNHAALWEQPFQSWDHFQWSPWQGCGRKENRVCFLSKGMLRNCCEVQWPLACNRSGYGIELRNKTTLLKRTPHQRESWPFFTVPCKLKLEEQTAERALYLVLLCINPNGTMPRRLALYAGLVPLTFFSLLNIFTTRIPCCETNHRLPHGFIMARHISH